MNKLTLPITAPVPATPVARAILTTRSTASRHTIFEAALPEPISVEQAEKYIVNPSYGSQRTCDGMRMAISRLGDNSTIAYNLLGEVIPLSPSLLAKLPVVGESEFEDGGYILDGELLPGDVYVVFDLLKLGHEYEGFAYRNTPMRERHRHLSSLLEGTGIKVAELAITQEKKITMVREGAAHCGTGVVFKKLASPVMPGRQGTDVRLTFWAAGTLRACSNEKQPERASLVVEPWRMAAGTRLVECR